MFRYVRKKENYPTNVWGKFAEGGVKRFFPILNHAIYVNNH